MDGVHGLLVPAPAHEPRNEHIRTQRQPQEQVDQQPDDRRIIAHRRQGLRPHKPPQDENIRRIEHLLQNADERHRDSEPEQPARQRPVQHIDRTSHNNLPLYNTMYCLTIRKFQFHYSPFPPPRPYLLPILRYARVVAALQTVLWP